MLFNSYQFLFLFLPVAIGLYFLLGRYSIVLSAASLALMSLLFYACWSLPYVLLLLASITANFLFGSRISQAARRQDSRRRTLLLCVAVVGNLGLLGYFKYANFFLETIAHTFSISVPGLNIVLPLGISFFTFTQIAFLVDSSRGYVTEPSFVNYVLFVTYFPHLIAGPVLHHAEMMPQFAKASNYRIDRHNVEIGATIFSIGLFKKVVLADGAAIHSTPVFEAAAIGSMDFYTAWTGALCYTLQLYFDFSGYSDMAIGLSRLFGILLPLNFDSPYKAASMIDFWRRWHMTLSRFLRDYLYIPLGGSRHGTLRHLVNLMITMLLGGLWHGAGWTYVVWGGLNGVYLILNHAWRSIWSAVKQKLRIDRPFFGTFLGRSLTFLAVVFAWVFFRSTNLESALRMITAMIDLPEHLPPQITLIGLPESIHGLLHWRLLGILKSIGVEFGSFSIHPLGWLLILLPIVWFAPNTQQLLGRSSPALDYTHGAEDAGRDGPVWRFSVPFAFAAGLMTLVSLLGLSKVSEFLYFQF